MPSEGPMAPQKITPKGLGNYLEVMSKSVFQPGISWKVIENKWPGMREAFDGFDAIKIAKYGTAKLDALTSDTRVVRNRRKLEAIIANAQVMQALEKEHGSFKKYLRSHADFDATVKDRRKRFKFMGEMGSYHFLYVVGEKVPPYEEWCERSGVKSTHGK